MKCKLKIIVKKRDRRYKYMVSALACAVWVSWKSRRVSRRDDLQKQIDFKIYNSCKNGIENISIWCQRSLALYGVLEKSPHLTTGRPAKTIKSRNRKVLSIHLYSKQNDFDVVVAFVGMQRGLCLYGEPAGGRAGCVLMQRGSVGEVLACSSQVVERWGKIVESHDGTI